MPLYDHHCASCGAVFERLVRGDAVPDCPRCHATTVERCVSRIAPAATGPGLVAKARRAAARQGHFSHYTKAERGKVPK